MNRSSEPAPTNKPLNQDDLDLEFPVAPDFISRPPRVGFQAMLRRCEEMLAYRNSRSGEEERRLREKIDVEFVL
jgi:hypothetical protein